MSQEKTIFNIKSQKLKGYAQFIFLAGTLTELKMNFKEPLSAVQKELFKLNFPFHVQDLDKFRSLGFNVVEKNMKKQMDNGLKVALWCKFYLKRFNVPYKIKPKEIGQLSNVDVSEQLLTAYLDCEEWWSKPKSVGNYVSHTNQIELLLKPVESVTSKHPNKYDSDYEKKLDGAGLVDYRRHLREMGYKPVKNATGAIIDWR